MLVSTPVPGAGRPKTAGAARKPASLARTLHTPDPHQHTDAQCPGILLALRRSALRLARELLGAGVPKGEVREELAARYQQRRDIRRTGVVRLGEAGVTTPQIAALSGHKIDYAQKILDTYLPRRSEVALAGMEVWERQDGLPSTVVRIPTRSRRG